MITYDSFKKIAVLTFILSAFSFFGCSGGGDSGINSVINNELTRISLSMRFISPQTGQPEDIASSSTGRVEVIVFKGSYNDAARTRYIARIFDYAARSATIEVFAGSTYSFSVIAKIKQNSGDTFETVYTSTGEVFAAAKPVYQSSATMAEDANGLKLDLKYSNKINLYLKDIIFETAPVSDVINAETMPAFSVRLLDQNSNLLTGAVETVEVSADNTAVVITGETFIKASGGGATFKNIKISSLKKFVSTKLIIKAGTAVIKSGDVNIRGAGEYSFMSSIEFDPAPPPLVRAGIKWPEFKVKILDQYGGILNTDETVFISSDSGSLSGTFAVRAVKGTAVFDDVICGSAGGKIVLKASSAGKSVSTGRIGVVNKTVKTSSLYVSTYTSIYRYELFYGGNDNSMEAAAVFKWRDFLTASGIIDMKADDRGEKLYAIDGENYFWALSGLENASPSKNAYNLTAFSGSKIVGFTPSADGLAVYLASESRLYKWHIVNQPDYIVSSYPQTLSKLNNVIECGINSVYSSSNNAVYFSNFSVFPASFKAESSYALKTPCALDISIDKKYVFAGEAAGDSVFKISASGREPAGIFRIGNPGVSGEKSFIKYIELQGPPKIFSAKPLDDAIYCLDISSGNSSSVTGLESFSPAALAATADQRLVVSANSGAGAFIRLIDASDSSFVGDIVLTERSASGEIPLLENIKSIVVR